MPLILALCLALLRALVAPPAGPVIGPTVAAPVQVAAWGDQGAADRIPRLTHDGARPAHEDVRAAAPVTELVTGRGEARGWSIPVPAVGGAAPRLTSEATYAAEVRARALGESHVVAARGGVLPYFPTAPPLQG